MHAKLTLLVWKNRARILIGSANLTEYGYRKNRELMAAFDFGVEESCPPELLLGCVAFLNKVRHFAPGGNQLKVGPQAALVEFLRSVEHWARTLPPVKNGDVRCELLPLIPAGPNILKQLGDLWNGPSPDQAWVLSPFFDENDQAGSTATAFAEILTSRGPRSVSFVAPGRKLPDGTVQIDIPGALRTSSHPSLSHEFSFVDEFEEIEGEVQARRLHAKSIWLGRDRRVLFMLGSSNFTAAGLGLHRKHNIELNVAYLIKDNASQFAQVCAKTWPPEQGIDDPDVAQFEGGSSDSAENDDAVGLPSAFGSALFYLDAEGGHLELELGTNAPANFEVRSKNGRCLLEASKWIDAGKQKTTVVAWEDKRPPSSLTVTWWNEDADKRAAYWVVNVADMQALPPPDELGSLSLVELIEILTSARPMHDVIMRIFARREKSSTPKKEPEVDPHKKVDTSQFLLRRMRRVAQALEGMRERLQQPMGSIDSLRWRLRGPIGPIALAKRLTEEDPAGAAFMIAEVAATLREVPWKRFGSLEAGDLRTDVNETMVALSELAFKAPAPTSLAKYVRASFEEFLQ